MDKGSWAIGVDLGGTKIEVACVDDQGVIHKRLKFSTRAREGVEAIEASIIAAVRELLQEGTTQPAGLGIGVAGQIDRASGTVLFGPNLQWHDVPLRQDLEEALGLPVVVTNDVRAATWSEWLYGAGKGASDLVCLFIGTGIGGGVVLEGEMIYGCTSTAGEVGHTTVDLNGPICKCGRRGCMEAYAGGAALTDRAKEELAVRPKEGALLRELAGEQLRTQHIVDAYRQGDELAMELITAAHQALVAGVSNLINSYNPCRLVLGGGMVQGLPEIVDWLREGVPNQALEAATRNLEIMSAQYGNDAGVVGAASVALRQAQQLSQHRQ